MARAPETFETARLRAERSHRRQLELFVPFEQDERLAVWLGGAAYHMLYRIRRGSSSDG